jgi:[protein-PII] uridylyltransferase
MSGKPIRPERHKEIEANILKGIEGTLGIQDKLARQKSTHKPPKRDMVFDIPAGMAANNKASLTDTLVEVYGRDRPGLLYDIASVLRDEGLAVRSAKINTYGLKALDVFYVQDKTGGKITDKEALARLEKRLKLILA